MNPRLLVPLAVLAVAMNACSGGGASGASATPPLASAAPRSATGTLAVGTPASGASAALRRPAYNSGATTFANLWIDGSPAATRVACPESSSDQCTINWTSTSGQHTFTVALDNSASISGGGTVLSDNSETVTLTAGANTLPVLTLNGVAAQIEFVQQSRYAAGNPACTSQEIPGTNAGLNCYIGTYYVLDAAYQFISDTSANSAVSSFDNGGVCVQHTNPSGLFYLSSASGSSCYSLVGVPGFTDGTPFIATCVPGANGTFQALGEAQNVALNSSPQAGEVSAQQLATYALVYPNQTYAMLFFPTYTCTAGTIS